MTFNSFVFWLVFPIIFGIYWLIPTRWNQFRKFFLIIVSYLLYMNYKPTFALVLLAVTLTTYCGGYLIGNQYPVPCWSSTVRNRKYLMWLFALFSLLPLLIFKYYNFVNEGVWSMLSSMGLRYELRGLNWAIPIGISLKIN